VTTLSACAGAAARVATRPVRRATTAVLAVRATERVMAGLLEGRVLERAPSHVTITSQITGVTGFV
jgi:hypothetical protein